MSAHLNLSTGKFLNSSTLFKLSDALLLDVSSGEIVMSNLLVPRAGVDLFKLASLDLNFAQRKSLTDRVSGNNLVTFSRASTGTYVDNSGVIQTASADTPRFDHDPVTGESLGLLTEEARTNLMMYSEQFDQWTVGSASSVTPNVISAPDGTNTADRVQHVGSGSSWIRQNVLTVGTQYTASVYAKAVTPGTNDQFSIFYGSDGAVKTATSEWQRFTWTFTASDPSFYFNNGDDSFDTDIYMWGAQLEAGSFSFPTSYIPTASSTVTRAADVASITGTNFSSFYNEPASTLYIESPNFPNYGNISNSSFVYISDVNTNSTPTGDGIKFGTSSPATGTRIFVTEAGATQAQFPVGAGSKFAIAVSENDVSYIIDGVSEGTDNTVVVPTGMNRLVITPYGPGLAHLSRLAYFPTRKSDQDLIDLTT